MGGTFDDEPPRERAVKGLKSVRPRWIPIVMVFVPVGAARTLSVCV